LRYGPDGSGFAGLCSWPLGPFDGVAADEFVDDDGIAERFPEHRVQVGHGRGGERLAVAASAGQQVAVQLGDRGRPDGRSAKRWAAVMRRSTVPVHSAAFVAYFAT
jgi:hypothetical protein